MRLGHELGTSFVLTVYILKRAHIRDLEFALSGFVVLLNLLAAICLISGHEKRPTTFKRAFVKVGYHEVFSCWRNPNLKMNFRIAKAYIDIKFMVYVFEYLQNFKEKTTKFIIYHGTRKYL